MASKFENVLSSEDIEYINNLPEVLVAKNKLEKSNKVYFSIYLTDSIRETLSQRFDLDFTGINQLPMRWIKEDTLPHIDVGSSSFENTYLVYLNNNSGNLIVDDESYNITENTGFKFSEGLLHKTVNTGVEPRLLIGPMSEKAFAVGVTGLSFYANQTDALLGLSNNDIIWIEGNSDLVSLSKDNKIYNYIILDKDDCDIILYRANDTSSSSILDMYIHKEVYPKISYINEIKSKSIK